MIAQLPRGSAKHNLLEELGKYTAMNAKYQNCTTSGPGLAHLSYAAPL